MKNHIKIAVIGGTGKSGKYLVKTLLAKGYSFKLLLRNPKNFKIESELIEIVKGDVSDYKTVRTLLNGCDAVLSTLGYGQSPPANGLLFNLASKNVLKAMEECGVKRYIQTTGINVNTPFDKKSERTQFATDWMYKNFPNSTKDKQVEYETLAKNDVDWTLVRLPMIMLTDENPKIVVNLEDCLGDKISATSLAHFLIEQVKDTAYLRQAPFIADV